MTENLKVNSSLQAQETGGPATQNMARVGEDFFGIENYMDTSGSFEEGMCQPCNYKKYLTYTLVASTGLPGEACIFCGPFWGFEFVCLKILPQWATCLASMASGGAV